MLGRGGSCPWAAGNRDPQALRVSLLSSALPVALLGSSQAGEGPSPQGTWHRTCQNVGMDADLGMP